MPIQPMPLRVSIMSFNPRGFVIRHSSWVASLMGVEFGTGLDAKDATFEIRQGLQDPNLISFKCLVAPYSVGDYENKYLSCRTDRVDTSDNRLSLESTIVRPAFPLEATFAIVPALAIGTPGVSDDVYSFVSFRAFFDTSAYIRARDGNVWVEKSTLNPTNFEQDASWQLAKPRYTG